MDEAVKVELERIHDENIRQNHRIEKLEVQMESLHKIETNIEKLALSMEQISKEQVKQGADIVALKSAPAEAWSNTKRTIFNSVLGAIGSAIGMAILYAIINYVK